jgi:glucose-6-phosphate isomerase
MRNLGLINNSFGVSPKTLPAWKELEELAKTIENKSIVELFNEDTLRSQRLSIQHDELFLDYSKNLVDDQVLSSLFSLANQSLLKSHRAAMLNGEPINTTEQRAVLHMALRGKEEDNYRYNDEPVHEQVELALNQMSAISHQVREGTWLGSTGKAITDVIHLGVGGSDLGPRMACQALRAYGHNVINLHFVSNADGAEILSTIKDLNPETTLIIIVSKSFSTQETMLNANTALKWLQSSLEIPEPQASPHVIGVTANRINAEEYGVDRSRVLEFQDWVGGRFSLWSSVGLSVSIYIGHDNFKDMLDGAREMDIHFKTAPLEQNMPVILALLGIWYNNFLHARTQAVIPYCERMTLLPAYLQQLEMESNGKSTSLDNKPLDYATAPIIWGQTGTDAQHAFFQLLHQGTHYSPLDLIGFINDPLSNQEHHSFLLNNLIAQAAALMKGKSEAGIPTHKIYKGNKPSNILLVNELSPKNFGAIIALYEHKVFVQGSIWNINSYDQWGVELGKTMTSELLTDNSSNIEIFDNSTQQLSEHIKRYTHPPTDKA